MRKKYNKNHIRKKIKSYIILYDYDSQIKILKKIYAENLIVWPKSLPEYCNTLSWSHVRELKDTKANIQNHGAWHLHPFSGNWEDTCKNIELGYTMLKKQIDLDADIFAVPYGDSIPLSNKFPAYMRYWLMLTNTLFPGQVGLNIFNRSTLILS